MHLVAVYGTLQKGFGNHKFLAQSRFVGKALTEPNFTLLHLGGFPGIVRSGHTAVSCEVYEVDDATLARLDRLEGHPTFYERQPLTVTMDGTEISVEGYVLPTSWLDGRKIIPTGMWGKDQHS